MNMINCEQNCEANMATHDDGSAPVAEHPTSGPTQHPTGEPQSTSFTGDSRSFTDITEVHTFFLSMIANIPSHSDFANLSPDDHEKLLNWTIHYKLAEVRDLLARPRPDGLAIKTSINSISRYRRKYLGKFLDALQEEQSGIASDMKHLANPNNLAELETATHAALRRRLFTLAIQDNSDLRGIRTLSRVFEKLKDQSIATRRLDIVQRIADAKHPAPDDTPFDPKQLKVDIEKFFGV